MAEEATFGDFILGMEGLAIMRSWMVDPVTVKSRARKIVEVAARLDEEPWSTPIAGGERTVTAGYAEWAATYDSPGNPVVLAEEPVVREIIARYPVGAALDAACGSGRHAAYPGLIGTPGDWHRRHAPICWTWRGRRRRPPGSRPPILRRSPCRMGRWTWPFARWHSPTAPTWGRPSASLRGSCGPADAWSSPDVHPVPVMLGGQGSYRRNGTELGFVRNYVHLASDYLSAFRAAGLDVVQCLEPLWGEQEIAAIRFAGEMPDLVEAVAKGLPIVIVWELEKPPLAVS